MKRTQPAGACHLILIVAVLSGTANTPWQAILRADDGKVGPPVERADSFAAIADLPLTSATWPKWREVYTRIFFDEEIDSEKEKAFYEQVHAFFTELCGKSNNALPNDFQDDATAWIAWAWTCLQRASESQPTDANRATMLSSAEDACRKAIALGDPQGIAMYSLAATLIQHVKLDGGAPTLTEESRNLLIAAEEQLRLAAEKSPAANVTLLHGEIAILRGDKENGLKLLRKAAEEHPQDDQSALVYLMQALSDPNLPKPHSDTTKPFAERFPKAANIHALHAVALYSDQLFTAAAESMDRALRLDKSASRLLGEQGIKNIEDGRNLTPAIVSGIKALEQKQFSAAVSAFRGALAETPANVVAARMLSRALCYELAQKPQRSRPSTANSAIDAIAELSQQFPGDGEIHAHRAVALHLGGRSVEAAGELERARELGANPDDILGLEGSKKIRGTAKYDATVSFWSWTAVLILGGAALWIGAMFALGAGLAVCIPRLPASPTLAGDERTTREVWLERLYLLVLSLGLLGFYLSVPIVALGLLAVTLAVFGALLMLRVLHVGVLHRGLWATSGIVRCALMGNRFDVLGIEATAAQHPRLFEALQLVAKELQTEPIDIVYLTPSSNIGVHEKGAGPFGLFGKRKRVLEIGISTLPLLTIQEFKSILAHEYGHFTHNDTFYSRFIAQVSNSLAASLAVMNAAGGVLNYVNPFYWFWWLYLRAYSLLSAGFSRSREFLADRRAVFAYGKGAFTSGLTKAEVDGVLFESTAYREVSRLLTLGQAYSNIFAAFRAFRDQPEIATARESLTGELRQKRPTWFDTHPTLSERLAAVNELPDLPVSQDSSSAMELLRDAESVESELTELLTSRIYAAAEQQ